MPELRQAILDQKFHRHPCPDCRRAVVAEPTMLYTDFERKSWFAAFPQSALVHRRELAAMVEAGFTRNMEVACPPLVRSWAPGFTVRAVFGLPSLREKLLLEEAGIEDRLVELAKLRYLRDHEPRLLQGATRVWVDSVAEEALEFVVVEAVEDSEVIRRVRVSRAGLAALEPALAASQTRWPDAFGGCVVDWRSLFTDHLALPAASEEGAVLDRLYALTTP